MTNTVAPSNMGKRLDFNAKEGKYNVNVADLISRIEALEKAPVNEPINIMDLSYLEPNAEQIPNLNNIQGLGWKPFYGNIAKLSSSPTRRRTQHGTNLDLGYDPLYVIGSPVTPPNILPVGQSCKWIKQDESEYTTDDDYDFSGYQLATYVEIVQVLTHGSVSVTRTNDSGMNVDGTLVNPDDWGDWVRG